MTSAAHIYIDPPYPHASYEDADLPWKSLYGLMVRLGFWSRSFECIAKSSGKHYDYNLLRDTETGRLFVLCKAGPDAHPAFFRGTTEDKGLFKWEYFPRVNPDLIANINRSSL